MKTLKQIKESLDEGRMKELHGYIDKGMSASQIAKKMKLDVKTISALMSEGAFYGRDDLVKKFKTTKAQRKLSVRLVRDTKGGYERATLNIKKDAKKIAQLKKDGYKVDPTYYTESKSATGYDLYHKTFSGAMQHSYAFAKKKFGIEIDPDEIDNKVALGPKKPSKGKTNSYRLKGKDGKKGIQVQVANLDNKRYELNMYKEETELKENYRTLARKGMGTETKKDARVGLEIDFYETERGDKVFGKIIKVTNTGYTVQAQERGNNKKYNFVFHDRAKAKKLLETNAFTTYLEGARDDARRAMSADPDFKSKDSKDIKATDDDRKAADKNPIIQLRRISDLPKGGKMEFKDKKTAKISQADAKKALRGFNTMRKANDKIKFTNTVGKSHADLKRILKIIR